ncbi:MAG: ABC transporter permease [Planctomycetes bacterium]|nr:ABC transporter permease [Planctomycetota bacterium]MBI3834630.1 ABC transporter permease [Planctomycetota bacterium]
MRGLKPAAQRHSTGRASPLGQLFLARMRMFYRAPEAIFWTYGFPILLTIGLGVAFRAKGVEKVTVAIEDAAPLAQVRASLEKDPGIKAKVGTASQCADWIRKGEAMLAVINADGVEYRFDPTRPDASLARLKVDDVIQRGAGRPDAVHVTDMTATAPGARYIDFLVPGLLGMNLMGGGLWGIGFVIVDMRIRKLLKRLIATPMRKRDFFFSVLGARMAFMVPEMILLLLTGRLLFGVAVAGSAFNIAVVIAVGAVSFAGLGLLAASRADKLETITGLMNVIMLPMWIFSGVFFAASRFPDAIQPFIQALPLTQLNNALRAVISDGASLSSQWMPLTILAAYGTVSFLLALRIFRWT